MVEEGASQVANLRGSDIFTPVEGVIHREIAGESLLVPVKKGLADLEVIFTTNGLGAFIWGRLDGVNSMDTILAAVLESYDVTSEQARADVVSFFESLLGLQLIVRRA